jgi:hypothetical protein
MHGMRRPAYLDPSKPIDNTGRTSLYAVQNISQIHSLPWHFLGLRFRSSGSGLYATNLKRQHTIEREAVNETVTAVHCS